MSNVLVVLTNWSRPANLPVIIQAFKRQTVSVDIVCIDNSHVDAMGLGSVGVETWRVPRNLGPPCRFVPAAADVGHEFVLFFDDDMVPGPSAVDGLLKCAADCHGKFATIGQIGRRFGSRRRGSILRYRRLNSPRLPRHLCPCDMTCRAHFVRREAVVHALAFRELLIARKRADCLVHVGIHDDILLCQGAQLATGWPSYLIPIGAAEYDLNVCELDDSNALNHRRRSHVQERHDLANWSVELGWKSLWKDCWLEMLKTLSPSDAQEVPQ